MDTSSAEAPKPPAVHADGLTIAPLKGDLRARLMQIITLRAQGLNNKEAAERLGLSLGHVRNLIYKASKEGWLKFENPLERFEQEIVPKVVDNIEHWIDKKDKQMTIEAAKGAGIFKSHQALKVEGDSPQTVLALKIETVNPAGEPVNPQFVTGHVIGKPRQLKPAHE